MQTFKQALKPGTLLQGGKYKIIKPLGQGGFGIAYLAENVMMECNIVIKEFFFSTYCNRADNTGLITVPTEANREIVDLYRQKFIKEARTIYRLNHPNIIKVHGIFEENGTAYYIMDYIEGESLSAIVKSQGAIPEAEAILYIKEVGKALSYIHSQKINHLDVKPANILKRKSDGQIILIDFGVAKQYDTITAKGTTTTPVGISPGYSPAEQYARNGVQNFSPQSDVYALGATLYKLLTGVTPPESMNLPVEGLPQEPLHSHNVSVSSINAIMAAMKDRNERTQSVEEFIKNLDIVVNEDTEQTTDVDKTIYNKDQGKTKTITTVVKPPVKLSYTQSEDSIEEEGKNKIIKYILLFAFIIGLIIAGITVYKVKTTESTPEEYYLKGRSFYYKGEYEEAARYYLMAAENGNAEAQCWLGTCYEKGEGVEQDYREAVKWYTEAAENGHARAQNNLGYCYEKGLCVRQNYSKAVYWYKESAEQENEYGQYNLGCCYYNGRGVEQNYKKAVRLFRESAEQGNVDAQRTLHQLGETW